MAQVLIGSAGGCGPGMIIALAERHRLPPAGAWAVSLVAASALIVAVMLARPRTGSILYLLLALASVAFGLSVTRRPDIPAGLLLFAAAAAVGGVIWLVRPPMTPGRHPWARMLQLAFGAAVLVGTLLTWQDVASSGYGVALWLTMSALGLMSTRQSGRLPGGMLALGALLGVGWSVGMLIDGQWFALFVLVPCLFAVVIGGLIFRVRPEP